MLLLLDENHKLHLEILSTLEKEVVVEFFKLAIEFISDGVNSSKLETAAHKLKLELSTVENLIDGLMFLLAESAKLMINEVDFHDSILTLGVSEDICKELVSIYTSNKGEIRLILDELSLHPVQYQDLEWRLNVKLASRSLQGQAEPNLLLRLHTSQGDSAHSQLLQCDIPNLINLTNSLDEALQESKSHYTRRILRNIK
ncbi:COMMD2 [Bugula neritina]|uniref:COMMD2 n=1 Tax=Bugula neritina TaxID=10212 RepID=A0A7J7JJX7_BUGNE|nr:COMMD2 [Bugula neritina]